MKCLLLVYALLLHTSMVSSASWGTLIQQAFSSLWPGTRNDVEVDVGLPDARAQIGRLFHYTIPHSAFTDMHFQVREAGSDDLPSWLYFNQSLATLSGVPSPADKGTLLIEVVASSSSSSFHPKSNSVDHKSVTASFLLQIQSSSVHHSAQHMDISDKFASLQQEETMDTGLMCTDGDPEVTLTLLLDQALSQMSAQERVDLISNIARYLSKSHWSIQLLPEYHEKYSNAFMLVAGPGSNASNLNGYQSQQGSALSWTISCGDFEQAKDITTVMEHNIKSGRIIELLQPFNLKSWYVSQNRAPGEKRVRREVKGTATPSIGSSAPTKVSSIQTTIISETSSTSTMLTTSVPTFPTATLDITKTMESSFLPSSTYQSIQPTSSQIYSTSIPAPSSSFLPSPTFSSSLYLPVYSSLSLDPSTILPTNTFTTPTPSLETSQIVSSSMASSFIASSSFGTTTVDVISTSPLQTSTLSIDSTVFTTSIMPTSTVTQIPSSSMLVNTTDVTTPPVYVTTPAITDVPTTMPDNTTVPQTTNVPETPTTDTLTTLPVNQTNQTVPTEPPLTTENITTPSTNTTVTPTTEAPPTEAPTTDAPSTEAPITDAPTTATPTMEAPTTAAPTTEAPTTEAPTTVAPTTAAPTTQAPTTKAPNTQAPTTQAPTTQAPTTQAPTTQAPTTESPTTAAPTTTRPTTAAPTTEAPTTEAPTTEAPTTEAPTTEAPTTEAPTTEAPTTEAPTTEAPTTEAPTTAAPTTEAPTTAAPTTAAPTTAAPTTEAPTTQAPTTEAPTTAAPTTTSPTTAAPTTASPTTEAPTTEAPTTKAIVTTLPPPVVTTVPRNTPPILGSPIDRINTQLGTYFRYLVPEDTFYDAEDGNTRNLQLAVYTIDGGNLTDNSFVQFDENRQVIYGLPLQKDVTEDTALFYLVATDSAGFVARDAFEVRIITEVLDDITFTFQSRFSINYDPFVAKTTNIIDLVSKVNTYYGDSIQQGYTSVTDLRNGSVDLFWTNRTVTKEFCDNTTILELYSMLELNEGDVRIINPAYKRAMLPEYPVSYVDMQWMSPCLIAPVTTPVPPPYTEPQTDGAAIPIWLIVLIVILIVLLIILIIVLVCCIVRRKRQNETGRWMPEDEKPIFGYNRKPVLLESELEMQDSSNKPRKPVIMTRDSQPYDYSNRGFEPQAGPSKRLPPPQYQSRPPSRLSDEDSLDAGSESPPPDYYVEPFMHRRPPPAYRLPPPYLEKPGSSEI